MKTMKNVLIVEDSRTLARIYESAISDLDIEIRMAETLVQARSEIDKQRPDLILLDLVLPDGNGIELLKNDDPKNELLCIVMTANGSVKSAVDAMREGAYDFLVKPFAPERLAVTVKNALATKVLKKTVQIFEQMSSNEGLSSIVGDSIPMQTVYRLIKAVAPTDASVMITGETGTGKELVAESIHNLSKRHKKPYIILNCAAIPKDLLESELFGHLKGAFTGASTNRDGAAHLANGGTLFLDELGEMDISLQSKLLRFIQQGTFQRVGSSKTEKVSVRFVAATNRDPLVEIAEGRFREDLYYRLNVFAIALPPLRERGDDVIKVAQHFLQDYAKQDGKKIKGFGPEVIDKLRNYYWPGNIRQLQNVVRNTVIFCNTDEIQSEDLQENLMPRQVIRQQFNLHASQQVASTQFNEVNHLAYVNEPNTRGLEISAFSSKNIEEEPANTDAPRMQIEPMSVVETKMIDMALSVYNGNVSKVASALEISPSSVYRKKTG